MPGDTRVELYVGGGWSDVTDLVYQRDPVTISYGAGGEDARFVPADCRLTLDNRDGRFSPRNPTGPYYGSLRRGTPLRVSRRWLVDDFQRTASPGWGSVPGWGAWQNLQLGTASASITPGAARHTIGANSYRFEYLPVPSVRDVDVRVTVTVADGDITGASVEPANVLLRGQDGVSYVRARAEIRTDESVWASLVVHTPAGEFGMTALPTGVAHVGGRPLHVRAQAEGNWARVKVWADGSPEPYGWHAEREIPNGAATPMRSAGWVGIRSGVNSGSTDAPVTFDYSRLEVRSPRFAGEVAEWPPRWDTTGRDAHAPIQAAGPTRRLEAGNAQAASALRRGIETLAVPVVGYWPCEEGERATYFASTLDGAPPMIWANAVPELAADDVFDCSRPLPRMNFADWGGYTKPYPGPYLQAQVRALVAAPENGDHDDVILLRVHTAGGAAWWDVVYNAAGSTFPGTLRVNAYNSVGILIGGTGTPVNYQMDGAPARLGLALVQNGSTIEWTFSVLKVGDGLSAVYDSGTIAAHNFGMVTSVLVNVFNRGENITVGHISVQREVSDIFELSDQLNAWASELAPERVRRLCGEARVPVALTRAGVASGARMGTQRPEGLLDLLDECAEADLGELFEARGHTGLGYRAVGTLQAQTPVVTLPVGSLVDPFEPVDDDRTLRNDVAVTRRDGSSAYASLDSGPLSTLQPSEGGVGRYSTEITVNVGGDVQLPDIAGWLLNLGTVDRERYPRLCVELSRSVFDASPATALAVLDLAVGDRLAVQADPSRAIVDPISQLVRGWTETLGPDRLHRVEFSCVPEEPYRSAVADATLGRIDSSSSTLVGALTSSATSFQVASTAERWTTETAQFPLDVLIGGERMTVSAIAGTVSPQTFTISARSVNGVVKAHPAGAPVRVADPVVYGI